MQHESDQIPPPAVTETGGEGRDSVEGEAALKEGLYIRTFGCQMNEYDTLKLQRILDDRYELVDSPEKAGVVLVNTCSVREKPEQKLFSLLGELRDLKNSHPHLLIGVGGCVAQQEGERIIRRNRAVDFVFGTHNLSLVPSLIERRRSGLPPQVAVDYRDEWETLPLGLPADGRVSVFVSISRGCNKNCTYCIVPITRGKEVSRPFEEIVREIKISVHRGAREVVLLGQTVNSYGLDLVPRMRFAELLERLAGIEGLHRIRFTSPHPQEIRDDFVELVARTPKVCRHVHLPLQSGSDTILKAMNRNYRRSKYLRIVERLKERIPDIAITTDIIVGFPGETDEDFMATMDMLERVRYDNSYSFVYSARPGTPAAAMTNQVPDDIKRERLARFQKRQEEITAERLLAWVGRHVEVLFEGRSAADERVPTGRTSQNLTVNLSGGSGNSAAAAPRPGDVRTVCITDVARFTLKGELAQV